MAHLLGIDIGTSGTKTLLCDERGRVLATASSPHDLDAPRPGWSEQAPGQWWSAVCSATRAVLKKARVKKHDVSAIGLSGQMHGSVFLGEGVTPLRPAILWNDQRTAEQCQQIEQAAGGRKKLIQMVGNPALTGFTAPKVLWVRQHEPRIYDKTKHLLLPKDYIRLCMTGQYATEVGDASGTLLLDVKKRAYHRGLLGRLQIDTDLLAPVYESHEITGHLTRDAAELLGLAEGTPVVGGSGDQPAGAVGNGIVTAGIASATLGTSGVVFAHSDQPTYDPDGRVHTMCAAVPGQWCVFGCMLSAAGSFHWLRNHVLGGDADYDLLVNEAASVPPGSEGLYFLPYLTGERCPHPDPRARGGWIGLTVRHTRAHLIRALLEGVTFGMADQVRIMDAMGLGLTSLRLSGGGAKNPWWRQLQADIYARPVSVTNADEGPAYGVALLAGVGTGVWRSVPEACRASIRDVEKLRPNAKLAGAYADHHAQYQRLYPALAGEFARWA